MTIAARSARCLALWVGRLHLCVGMDIVQSVKVPGLWLKEASLQPAALASYGGVHMCVQQTYRDHDMYRDGAYRIFQQELLCASPCSEVHGFGLAERGRVGVGSYRSHASNRCARRQIYFQQPRNVRTACGKVA